MSKQSKLKVLMIPFTYHHEDMMDYYDMNFSDSENNRKITWDTEENHRVWNYSIRTFQRYGESDEDFLNAQAKEQARVDEYNERINNGRYITVDEVIWKPNFEFEDKLKYLCYSRGRSSAKIHFQSEATNKKYEMFLTDFDDLMKGQGFNKNIVEGTFTFCKRGANYGIKLV